MKWHEWSEWNLYFPFLVTRTTQSALYMRDIRSFAVTNTDIHMAIWMDCYLILSQLLFIPSLVWAMWSKINIYELVSLSDEDFTYAANFSKMISDCQWDSFNRSCGLPKKVGSDTQLRDKKENRQRFCPTGSHLSNDWGSACDKPDLGSLWTFLWHSWKDFCPFFHHDLKCW